MIKKLLILTSFIILTACSSSDDDDNQNPDDMPTFTVSQTFQIDLSGKQEVPMSGSSESASATIELDESLMQFRASLDASMVTGVTAAHIHAGSIGQNGDVAFAFEDAGSGSWTIAETEIDADAMADLQAGKWYVNVHTEMYADGAVRGQIVNDTTTIVTFELSGKQEVPMVDTDAMGYGYATYDSATTNLELRAITMNVDDATAAHIHTGRIGMNGNVLAPLEQDSTDANVWATAEGTQIDAATFEVLASGGHYVNVHSDTYENGVIRGQILTDNFTFVSFKLDGEQQVPAVNTMAKGDGYALVDMNDYSLELTVVTEGVLDASAAHIHTGRIGTNGDVLVTLEQSTEDMNVWMAPEGTMLDADIFATLASGGHYINVHTPDNASGELRGQILTDNFVLATFALQGSQEVPAVDTMAMGSGYALVDMNDYSLELKVVTEGLDDATAAHIHTGRVGANGDVLVALTQSMDDDNVWMTDAGLMIDADTFATLASGGHYVNVHSESNASGELRGQILTDNFALATFKLTGAQEVPSITTNAFGDGYALVNMDDYSTEVTVVTNGIDDASAAHIHTGRVGENGDVLVGLMQSETDSNVWKTEAGLMIDADTFAVLASGGHYVNVHSETHASGHLRGQILTDNFVLVAFSLTGEQQVPAVASLAMGDGYALVDTNDYSVEMKVVTSGVADATAAHIHTGRVGENGDVLAALVQSETDANIWMAPDNLMIDAETFAVLAGGGHYVNVHTPMFPNGELRGQIITDNYVLMTFELTGDQQVPAVTTSASGDGYALVNTTDYGMEVRIVTDGIVGANAAHIHSAPRGENGPVLAALIQDVTDETKWATAVDLSITAEIFAELAAGGHYVNVHTVANADGEIRGQIE